MKLDLKLQKNDVTRISVGDLKMIVKKHKMTRDLHGQLKDVGNEEYLVNLLATEEIKQAFKKKNIKGVNFIKPEEFYGPLKL